MGNSSSQLPPEDPHPSDRMPRNSQPSSAHLQPLPGSSQVIGATADGPNDTALTPAERKRAKAERKADRAERRARKQARREERARRLTDVPATPDSQQPQSFLPPSSKASVSMAPRNNRHAGPAISSVRPGVNFAIDPALESLRHEGIASAERSTANMIAPMANMGALAAGALTDTLPTKKKRGRKSRKELAQELAQEQAVSALSQQHEDEQQPWDGSTLLSQLAAAAVAGQEEQQLLQQEADASAAQGRKRKRQNVADGEEPGAAEKPTKKKKKFAKRTDGAMSRSASPDDEEGKLLPESGTFQEVELKMLDNFMDRWEHDHAMSRAELADMVQSKHRGNEDAEGSFWAQVFDLLPRRKDRRSIRLTCRRRYHNFHRRGTWEPEDDQMLKEAYDRQPAKWTKIGEAINRMAEDCKDRYQNYLACGDRRRTGDWTEKEEMALSLAVEECKRAVREEAKQDAEKIGAQFRDDKDWMEYISFKSVSQKMDYGRSGLQCRQHWKRMQTRENKRVNGGDGQKKKTWRDTQAADNFKRMLPGDKYQVLLLIQSTDTSTEDNIPWKLLTRDNPDSKWTTKDRKVAFEKMKKLIPPQPTLPDELNALIAHFQQHHGNDLDLFYTGPVRSQDAPRRPGARKTDSDNTPAARIRKGQKSKGQHKSAQKVTASDDDEGETQADETAIDPALEDTTMHDEESELIGLGGRGGHKKKGKKARKTKVHLDEQDSDDGLPMPEQGDDEL